MGLTHEAPRQGATDTWLTPKPLLDAVGPFDLDPCAAPAPRPWPTAARHYDLTQGEDGLRLPWAGLVWLNPPYGGATGLWLARLAAHQAGGVAFVFARTETTWFHDSVWAKALGLLFLRGRVVFRRPDGTAWCKAPAPSVLCGYGEEAMRRLAWARLDGHLVLTAPLRLERADGTPLTTWRQVVQEAMGGRPARLGQIYLFAIGTPKGRAAAQQGVKWKEKIRRVLQEHFRPLERGLWAPAAA